jgi:hypothetical protein
MNALAIRAHCYSAGERLFVIMETLSLDTPDASSYKCPWQKDVSMRIDWQNKIYHSIIEARRLNSPGLAVLAGTLRLALNDSVPLGMEYTRISFFKGSAKRPIHQFAAVCSGTTRMHDVLNLSIS